MNYDNKNAAMKDKEAKILIYEFRVIGIADGVNIKIKKILDPLSEQVNKKKKKKKKNFFLINYL